MNSSGSQLSVRCTRPLRVARKTLSSRRFSTDGATVLCSDIVITGLGKRALWGRTRSDSSRRAPERKSCGRGSYPESALHAGNPAYPTGITMIGSVVPCADPPAGSTVMASCVSAPIPRASTAPSVSTTPGECVPSGPMTHSW